MAAPGGSALRKTVAVLLKGDVTTPELVEDAVYQAFDEFAPKGKSAQAGTFKELYAYLKASKIPPPKAVERLIASAEAKPEEPVTERELAKALNKAIKGGAALTGNCNYAGDHQMHVVQGSNRLNSQSGTSAFKLKAVTAGSMKRLRAVFDDLDSDHDGCFTLPEWRLYVQRTKPDFEGMAPTIFRALDEDRDGKVSFKQLIGKLYPQATPDDVKALMALAQGRRKGSKCVDPQLFKEMADIYEVYDDDHDGLLDKEEFLSAIQQAGYTEEELPDVWREVNVEGSGLISLDDFKVWYITSTARKLHLLHEDEDEA